MEAVLGGAVSVADLAVQNGGPDIVADFATLATEAAGIAVGDRLATGLINSAFPDSSPAFRPELDRNGDGKLDASEAAQGSQGPSLLKEAATLALDIGLEAVFGPKLVRFGKILGQLAA